MAGTGVPVVSEGVSLLERLDLVGGFAHPTVHSGLVFQLITGSVPQSFMQIM